MPMHQRNKIYRIANKTNHPKIFGIAKNSRHCQKNSKGSLMSLDRCGVNFFKNCRLLFPIIFLLALSGCSAMKAGSIMQGGNPAPLGTGGVVAAEQMGHMLTVMVSINGSEKKYRFGVDTGSITVISEDVARELGLEESVKITGKDLAGNEQQVVLTKLNQLSVGDVTVSDCGMLIADIGLLGDDVAGLLGSNFFRHFVVQIDYQAEQLWFSTGPYHPRTQKAQIIPFELKPQFGFNPAAECEIDGGVMMDCVIDTGYPFVASIPVSTFKSLPQFHDGNYVDSEGVMSGTIFGADEKSYLTKLDKLNFGPFELENVPVVTNRADVEIMTIGYPVFSNYLVTMDYPESTLYLEPVSESKSELTTFESFGLNVEKKEGTFVVRGIWHDSPAAKNGLSINDALYSVNDQDLKGMSFYELMALVQGTDNLDLEYVDSRTSERKKVSLVKKDLLLSL